MKYPTGQLIRLNELKQMMFEAELEIRRNRDPAMLGVHIRMMRCLTRVVMSEEGVLDLLRCLQEMDETISIDENNLQLERLQALNALLLDTELGFMPPNSDSYSVLTERMDQIRKLIDLIYMEETSLEHVRIVIKPPWAR